MNLPTFLFLTVTSVLVLRSGHQIEVDGPVREQNGQIVFRTPDGRLFSIAKAEIDEKATAAAAADRSDADAPRPRKLKVSAEERDRLLRELSENHTGTPPPPQRLLETPPPAPTPSEVREESREEWRWRQEARAYEENVRRAEETLQLLRERVAQLRSEIQGFLSLGYRPNQFSYQTTQLHRTMEQIPAAELAVRQAQRALEQFKDDARRQGILPGWLR